LNELRTIGRAVHAWVVPPQCVIPHAGDAFDEEGELKDPKLRKRLMGVGREVARFAALHASQEAQEFLSAWEKAPENPGG